MKENDPVLKNNSVKKTLLSRNLKHKNKSIFRNLLNLNLTQKKTDNKQKRFYNLN
jgi:hypothetical protein